MEDLFRSYLDLLGSLREQLEHLSDLARLKTAAVQHDDLLALDEVLRQEQAIALAFRGLEQKREKLLTALGIRDLSLSEVPGCYPPAMQAEAQEAVNALQEQYRVYGAEAQTARTVLESNLRDVEKILENAGAAPTVGAGYTPPQAETPPTMKTDFRA